MDLYIQVGILLVIASMFSLLVFFYSESAEIGLKVEKSLTKPSVNYSMDSSITTPTFFIDGRVFEQWALNAKSQRQVYLVYPNNITPDSNLYGSYLYKLEAKLNNQNLADRSLEIYPQVPQNIPNAFYVLDQSPKIVDYLSLYSETAKLQGQDEMVTVHTFTDTKTNEVIYVCYIK